MRSSICAQSCASVPPAAGLDVEERVVRVHLAREHAAELEALELLRDASDLTDHVGERVLSCSSAASSCSSRGLAERFVDAPERADDGFERRALAA